MLRKVVFGGTFVLVAKSIVFSFARCPGGVESLGAFPIRGTRRRETSC